MSQIQYIKEDGSLGEFDSEKIHQINVENGKFHVRLIHYGWDEYDFWYEDLENIIELRI